VLHDWSGWRFGERMVGVAFLVGHGPRRLLSPRGLGIAGAFVLVAGIEVGLVGAPPAAAQTVGGFEATGSLPVGVEKPLVAVLQDGAVLVAGGEGASGAPLSSAEIYQPASGAWAPTGSLLVPVFDGTATVLADGDVLVAGGLSGSPGALAPTSASEIYDPATGAWSPTSGQLIFASFAASAALVPSSGAVLYAGGLTSTANGAVATTSAELYDPSTGTWSATGSLPAGVADAQMVALSSGSVLLAGGETSVGGTLSALSELYVPSQQTWTGAQAMPDAVAGATTTLLADGDVLVAGGKETTSGTPTNATQLFDPFTGGWTSLSAMPVATYGATATLLVSGEVLYAGGFTAASAVPTATAALFDPSSSTWSTTADLIFPLAFAGAARLANGDVLIAGGTTTSGVTGVSELYTAQVAQGAQATITSPASFNVHPGVYNSFTITTSGTPTPTLAESGALPPGLVFAANSNGTATISGTPAASLTGTYYVTITATNGVGSPAMQSLALVLPSVAEVAPTITSPASFNVKPGVYNSVLVTTSGRPTPTLSEYGALPPGLAFSARTNGTATISGTPAASLTGTYYVTITATNGVGSPARQRLALELLAPAKPLAPAEITSGRSVLVLPGRHSVISITTSGAPVPTVGESGTLPPGLAFSARTNGTATISGTPQAGLTGTYYVTITANNGRGPTAQELLRITVGVPPTTASPSGVGYWYTTSSGDVVAQGETLPIAPQDVQSPTKIVAMAATPDHDGYYLVSSYGGVFSYGDASWYGSIANRHLRVPTVAFAETAGDRGYYIVTSAGNVFGFGDARFYGSAASQHVPPIAAFALTPNDGGYWLVSTYGNVYAFGDAQSFGSPADRIIPPVVAFAPTPNGRGYWLVTSKGNVLNFGDAGFFGSPAGVKLPPVVAFAPTADGRGYWLVTSKGNVLNFGDARFFGSSAHQELPAGVTGFAPQL